VGNNTTEVIRYDREAKLCSVVKFQNLVKLHLVKKFLTAGHTLLDEMAAVN
jgi:hypothetical protein